jgi:hypothetical protein
VIVVGTQQSTKQRWQQRWRQQRRERQQQQQQQQPSAAAVAAAPQRHQQWLSRLCLGDLRCLSCWGGNCCKRDAATHTPATQTALVFKWRQ